MERFILLIACSCLVAFLSALIITGVGYLGVSFVLLELPANFDDHGMGRLLFVVSFMFSFLAICQEFFNGDGKDE